MAKLRIYHGSSLEIKNPIKIKGKTYNDYGQGFYCTKHKSLASQWACRDQEDGIVNAYDLDLTDLKVLHLNEDYHLLNWLAILTDNRIITGQTAISNKIYLIEKYMIDYQSYDVIIGYRADDAYYRIVREFLNNTIGVHTLNESMYLGELGLQVFIQSEKGFRKLGFVESYEVDEETYFTESESIRKKAIDKYETLKSKDMSKDTYMIDIRRGDLDEKDIPRIKIK